MVAQHCPTSLSTQFLSAQVKENVLVFHACFDQIAWSTSKMYQAELLGHMQRSDRI